MQIGCVYGRIAAAKHFKIRPGMTGRTGGKEKLHMKYGTIPGVEQQVSRIFLGTASAPFAAGEDGSELIEAALSLGINALDTARVYGLSENSLGRWLEKPGNRDRVVILSKCGHPAEDGTRRVNAREMRRDLETSLEALRTDRIDIYLLHRDDPEIPVGEIMECFQRMKEEGRIRAFGGSNWTVGRIAEANAWALAHGMTPMAVSSPQFGLASQVKDPWGGNCVTLSGPGAAEDRAWYRENRMAVVAYSSLGRGMMSGRVRSGDPEGAGKILDRYAQEGFLYPENLERLRRCEELAALRGAAVPQMAMRWVFSQELNAFAVVSTSSVARLTQNAKALELPLSPEEAAWLDLRRESRGEGDSLS